MTRLLISVRSLEEARLLPMQEIGILDIKEPNNGPLGCPNLKTISEIHAELGALAPISVALGELVDSEPLSLEQLPPVAYAKFGLSQLRTVHDWKSHWTSRISRLPPNTQPVAVIYADWRTCGAPSPEEVISAANEASCQAILVDTFEKTKGSLFQWQTFAELERMTQLVRKTPAKWVLAGGLRSQPDLQNALRLGPDLIGVRGAVCGEDRADMISSVHMKDFFRQFANLIKSDSVIRSRSIEPETSVSESRNAGITH